jgi:XTP/dITP diphosphohydrolase
VILCFATNNKYKLGEVARLIKNDFKIVSLEDIGCLEEIPETWPTIWENSHAKADYVFRNYHTNCFADDTGLEVDALGGEPGVLSARYAGDQKNSDDNIDLLLLKLSNKDSRTARFRTVFTLIIEGNNYVFEGIVNGKITDKRRGENGFGYDPVFLPDNFDLTFAEMTVDQKNRISHRAIATLKLVEFLNSGTYSSSHNDR